MSKHSVSLRHPATLEVDGMRLAVTIKRMAIGEFVEFERMYFKFGTPDPGVAVAVEGEADMTAEEAFFARAKAEADRQKAMTAEERDREGERALRKAVEMAEWMDAQVKECLLVNAGELDVEGRPVKTGADFMAVYGSQLHTVTAVINAIWAANKLPANVAKKLLSPSDSPATSGAPAPEPVGPRPAPTAGPARPGDSAMTGAATTAPRAAGKSFGGTPTRRRPRPAR